MQKARELAAAIALFPQTVLLLGPNGSGKELFARYIHFKSKRKGNLKTINCSLFTPERFQSELFGHVKGAFTGAMKDRAGLAMQADGGTLFLDEIGDCGLEVQAQLLRFLQEDSDDVLSREIIPLGADDPLPQKPKVRIIAATNKPLAQMVEQGAFREDLYYRLAAFEIQIPSLSQRKKDISELVEFFRAKTPYPQGLKKPDFSVGAIAALREYTWPGNVRQLKSCIGRLFLSAYMKSAEIIREEDVFEVMGHPCANVEPHEEDDKTLDALLGRIQKFWIERALAKTGGNKEAAAKLLGLKSGQTLSNRINAFQQMH